MKKEDIQKNLGKIITAIMATYFVFFMNLGSRTFAQHVIRIATTPEAYDLVDEMYETGVDAVQGVASRARGIVSGFSSSSKNYERY